MHLLCNDGPSTKRSKTMHHLYKVGKPRHIWLLADAAGSRQKITMWERHSRLNVGTAGSQSGDCWLHSGQLEGCSFYL